MLFGFFVLCCTFFSRSSQLRGLVSLSFFVTSWNSEHLTKKLTVQRVDTDSEYPVDLGLLLLKVKQEPGVLPSRCCVWSSLSFLFACIKKCTMNSLFSLYFAVKLLLTWTLGSQQKLSHLQRYHPTEMIREWQPKPCSPLFFSGVTIIVLFLLFSFCPIFSFFALQKRKCKTSRKKALLLQVLFGSSYKKTCQQTKLEDHILWKTCCSAAHWTICRHYVMRSYIHLSFLKLSPL